MAQEMTAWAKYETGMRFTVEGGSGHNITLDASLKDGGQDAGFRPIELLLVGLAGCTGMDVISMLKKQRQNISAYEVEVKGLRAGEHPMVFVEITVEHVVTGHNIKPEGVARAVELSASKYCGVGAMLDKVAKMTHTYRIVEEELAPAIISPERHEVEKLYSK